MGGALGRQPLRVCPDERDGAGCYNVTMRSCAAVLSVFILAGCAGAPPAHRDGAPTGLVPVVRVVDGDTIWVERGGEEKVRLIGIDTPEVDWYGGEPECFGEEAGTFLRSLLEGERVTLETDRELRDRYGRTLAYVYLEDGRMVNLLLVRRGYATVVIYPPNDRYEERLRAAERAARADPRGLWAVC